MYSLAEACELNKKKWPFKVHCWTGLGFLGKRVRLRVQGWIGWHCASASRVDYRSASAQQCWIFSGPLFGGQYWQCNVLMWFGSAMMRAGWALSKRCVTHLVHIVIPPLPFQWHLLLSWQRCCQLMWCFGAQFVLVDPCCVFARLLFSIDVEFSRAESCTQLWIV